MTLTRSFDLQRIARTSLPFVIALAAAACGPRMTTDGGGDGGDTVTSDHAQDGADTIVAHDGSDIVTTDTMDTGDDTATDTGDDTTSIDAGDDAQADGGLDAADTPSIDVPTGDGPIVVGDAVIITVDGSSRVCYPITCAHMSLQCGDCIDNDGDGLVDSEDPECLGPCSNNEGPTLDPGVGGTTAAACTINCYFNYGIGSGLDDCHWDHRCDPLEVAPDYPPVGPSCTYDPSRVGGSTCPDPQSTRCLDSCLPLTPNGCDCFGCCTFPEIAGRPQSAGGEWVFLGSRDSSNNPTCTLADVSNTALCHSCTPAASCLNTCGHCEVCIGRPVPPADCFPPPPDAGVDVMDVPRTDVPPGTDVPGTDVPGTDVPDGGSSMQCSTGVQPCGLPGQAPCPFNYYCITGCCIMGPG